MTESAVKLTIAFVDPELDLEERDEQAQQLIAELKQLDEVDAVGRVPDPNPPQGGKAFGEVLFAMLFAEVNVPNAKKVLGFLGDRLGNKPIELSVEGNGKKLSVKASSQAELEIAIKAAKDFLDS